MKPMVAKFATDGSHEPSGTPLWHYALDVYARPGVADELLRLQDHHHADVLWLLTALWLAERGAPLEIEQRYQPEYEAWRKTMILPVREQRRLCDKDKTPGLYELLKRAELEAEKEGLRILYEVFADQASGEADPLSCLMHCLPDECQCSRLLDVVYPQDRATQSR